MSGLTFTRKPRTPRTPVTPTARVVITFVALLLLAALASAFLVTKMNTEPDEVGLHYKGGVIQSRSFAGCIQPASKAWDGPGDKHYGYPFGQRTFEFSAANDADASPITVVTKDNVTMSVSGVATFALNTSCNTLRQFHERIGLKYQAWNEQGHTSVGWNRALGVYLKQPLDKAMDAISKQYTYTQLYSQPDVKEEWEEKVGELVVSFVEDQAGGNYFCQPSYVGRGDCGSLSLTIQNPVPPEAIVAALNERQQAAVETETQKTRNATQLTQSQGIRAAMRELGLNGASGFQQYVLYLAVQKGEITLLPVPQGSNLTLPTSPDTNR